MGAESVPGVRYDQFFRFFGLLSSGTSQYYKPAADPPKKSGSSFLNRLYCRLVCLTLWLFVIRTFALLFIWDRDTQLMLGDLTGYWHEYRLYYLMPMLFVSLHAAITCSIWRSKEEDLSWLVPFIESREHRAEKKRGTRSSLSKHKARLYIGIFVSLVSFYFKFERRSKRVSHPVTACTLLCHCFNWNAVLQDGSKQHGRSYFADVLSVGCPPDPHLLLHVRYLYAFRSSVV